MMVEIMKMTDAEKMQKFGISCVYIKPVGWPVKEEDQKKNTIEVEFKQWIKSDRVCLDFSPEIRHRFNTTSTKKAWSEIMRIAESYYNTQMRIWK